MKIFGMVTTRDSWEYTSYAIKSFFRTLKLSGEERLYLIDNDESFEEDASWFSPHLEIIKNKSPQSFSANVNSIMKIAEEKQADLYFLNNDIIFTENWINPLLIDDASILSPLSNREVQYDHGGVVWKNVMKLNEYLGKQNILKEVVELHKSQHQGYRKVISLPFFCIKIPYAVYSKVGKFDENFGKGGAEDNDYCLRAYLEGFDVKYALQSYVLHFSGKSTWAGGESQLETEERVQNFREVFQSKWGPDLLSLIIDFKQDIINSRPDLLEAAKKEDYSYIVKALQPNK